ncbi:DUF1493 family protein [Tenacibaculum maritimum]|uniref:DUF1493 family protein n=1 Tax=Tenacibaculum maritimum TaxID=107401 RepID=UPI0009FFD1DB|nr:DUF1493 family protein [Tenacibaculum maritimum]
MKLLMKNNQIIFNKLTDFIIQEYWGNKEKMTPDTRLEKDLGITGDDGIEFLENFLDYFKIDYEEKENRPRYFDDEGFGLINFISIFNFMTGKKDYREQYDLTLEHLVKVIELGHWIDMDE